MQGTCASCWAFSTTGAVEGDNFLASGNLLNLSEQQLVNCDHTKTECGCGGGLLTNAYAYLMSSGRLMEHFPMAIGAFLSDHHEKEAKSF
uniref:Peptidase C1A papain C-terminal domain-containing protein n=1 Tax=Oryza rufipogon TaxID=4529 RepID=A0A0E0MTR3_ORYRU